jgi:hypothetical protein
MLRNFVVHYFAFDAVTVFLMPQHFTSAEQSMQALGLGMRTLLVMAIAYES